MNWFSWLSKTSLEPSLVYEYGLTFAHNELEEEDIPYFDHEFLQSMGISIAKHRLQILKLARNYQNRSTRTRSIARLFVAIKKTKRCLRKYMHRWIDRDDRALVVVHSPSYSTSRWKSAMVKRNKKFTMPDPTRLLLTNGSPLLLPAPRVDSYLSPLVYDAYKEDKMVKQCGDVYWSTGMDKFRWDTLFQDLKPT